MESILPRRLLPRRLESSRTCDSGALTKQNPESNQILPAPFFHTTYEPVVLSAATPSRRGGKSPTLG